MYIQKWDRVPYFQYGTQSHRSLIVQIWQLLSNLRCIIGRALIITITGEAGDIYSCYLKSKLKQKHFNIFSVSDCVHSIVRRDTAASQDCQDGQVFCLESQSCAESCSNSFFPSDRETRTQIGQLTSGVQCPVGHVFCLSINACIAGDDCGPFENASGSNSANETCQVRI